MTAKQDLLEAEDARWQALQERLDRVPADAWEKPGVNGDWTVKDVLVHVAAWHANTTDRFEQLRATGDLPDAPDVDAFNAEQYQQCKEISLDDARVMFEAARHRLREELAQLDDITDRIRAIVAANGGDHYDEHIPQLDAFLEGM